MDQDTSDEALMLRYREGDAQAFDELYSRHRGGLFRFILRQCPLRGQAEEIFQDVWMKLVQSRRRYEVAAKFRTYLYTIAHHRLIDFYRSHASEAYGAYVACAEGEEDPIAQIAASRVDEPHVQAESREQGARLLRLLQTLSPPQREVFLLFEESGLTLEEIAAATGVSFEAAKSRLRYAVAKLRAGLLEVAA
jgi:RNA polymerase sigma-70 factor, ECF subfamily